MSMSKDPTSPTRVVMRFPTKTTLSLPGNWSWISMSPWTITIASFSSLSTIGLYTGHVLKHDILESSNKIQRLEVIISIELPSVGDSTNKKSSKERSRKIWNWKHVEHIYLLNLLISNLTSFWMYQLSKKSLRRISMVSFHVSIKITSAEIQTEPCYHSLLMRKTTSANTSTLPLCYKLAFFMFFLQHKHVLAKSSQ